VVGALQAMEAAKLLIGAGETLNGRLLLLDAKQSEVAHRARETRSRLRRLRLGRDVAPLRGQAFGGFLGEAGFRRYWCRQPSA